MPNCWVILDPLNCSIFTPHERYLVTINLGPGDPVELAAFSVPTDRLCCYDYCDSRSWHPVASSLAPASTLKFAAPSVLMDSSSFHVFLDLRSG